MDNLPIKDINFFNKGKRGLIYTGKYKGKKVGVKIKRPESRAENTIKKEYFWLKKLNKYGIGPKLLFLKNDSLIYEFAEGTLIKDYLKIANKKDKIRIFKNVFGQLRIMDKLKINKKEMHKPLKHIVIGKKIIMLDFERCYISKKPKNVTQFGQFLLKLNIIKKRKEFIESLKDYKQNLDEKSFKKILSLV
ncbi:hypothetical protein J4414_00780 [Candidatus Woesearchaeota archaeon]|nr:hypothetical protein [Candidatus Woesearchaeota archaeon]